MGVVSVLIGIPSIILLERVLFSEVSKVPPMPQRNMPWRLPIIACLFTCGLVGVSILLFSPAMKPKDEHSGILVQSAKSLLVAFSG